MTFEESDDDRTRTHVVLTKGTMMLHYRIVEKIGAGGMGEVYLAEDTHLHRQVALKFLPAQYTSDSDFKARFVREAEATAKLNHPNVITIHDVAEDQGRPFFAMELVEGQSLRDLAKGADLGLDRIVELAIQICDGLGAAHDKQVVHRDIKPSNIVIDAYGRPKILDFGLAAIQGGEHLTKTGSTLGTVRYMSPEQVEGNTVDHRSDLFSLGIVLYELISGRTPFEKDNEAATLKSIGQDNPEPLARYKSDIPDELQRIILKLLQKDPSLRYQSAAGVISDLKGLLRSTGSIDTVVTLARPQRLKPSTLLFAAIAIGVLVVATYVMFTRSELRQQLGLAQKTNQQWSNSIAVLPFRDFSSKQDQEPFCDGMTDAIIGKLSGISGLKVISMTSVMKYKSSDRDLRKIGQELRVANILEGSIQREEGEIRVQAQLIHATDDAHLWSNTYDREIENVFAIQDDISRSIVGAMKLELYGSEETSLTKRTTDNPEAYNAYVQGRYLWRKRTEEALMKSIEHFEAAIKFDSNYALAYSGLADAWSVLPGYSSYRGDSTRPKAMEAAEKALELDDQLVEAHASMGLVLTETNEYEKSEKEFLRAIELNPGYVWTHTWYSNLLGNMGRREENLERLQIAYDLDPLNLVTLNNLAAKKMNARKWEEAEVLYRTALGLEPAPFRVIRLGGLLQTLGRRQEAKDLFEHSLEQFPRNKPLYSALWNIYIYDEDLEAALGAVERLHEQKRDDTLRFLWLGEVYNAMNNYDQAIENYQRAQELKPEAGNAINPLIFACVSAGRFEEAIKYADMMVEGRPERPWPWAVRSEVNAIRGKLDKAIEDIEKAIELNPGGLWLYGAQGVYRLYQGDWSRAEALFQEKFVESDNPDLQTRGAYSMALLLAVQGKFNQALAYTDSCLTADSLDDRLWSMKDTHQLRMYIFEEMNDLEQATRESRRVVELNQKARPDEVIAWQDYLTQILADNGEFAEAISIADKLKAATEAGGYSLTKFAWCYTQSTIELARGNYEEAIRLLRMSAEAIQNSGSSDYFQSRLLLARTYLEAEKTEEAIALYETILSNVGANRISWVVQVTKARYHLAQAYEQAGRTDDAIAQYEDFLKRWGNADVRLESVEDARTHLTNLKQSQ